MDKFADIQPGDKVLLPVTVCANFRGFGVKPKIFHVGHVVDRATATMFVIGADKFRKSDGGIHDASRNLTAYAIGEEKRRPYWRADDPVEYYQDETEAYEACVAAVKKARHAFNLLEAVRSIDDLPDGLAEHIVEAMEGHTS